VSIISRPVISSEAMVLRVWSYAETSVIASLLTEKTGFVKVIAKGARKSKSNLQSLVQPGTLVDVEFTDVANRELQYLRGGSVQLDSSSNNLTLEKTSYLLAIVEIIDRCKPSGKDVDLFHLCRRFVKVLMSLPEAVTASAYYRFQLELMNMQGIAPVLDKCSNCQEIMSKTLNSNCFFSYSSGGVVCSSCVCGDSPGRFLTPQVYLNLCTLSEYGIDNETSTTRFVDRETGIVLHRFLEYYLPEYRLPTALDMLNICKVNSGS
jgi:DNA repair protein RecO (recombination protein O)